MGRSPCCNKEGVNRGAWTAIEDKTLAAYINAHGEGQWRNLPKKAGLKRCGKSCRLRWLNYLRPDIKRGNISHDEEDLIIRLHKLLGNRWSLIAGRLPGRTDNEIKNYWNTILAKKARAQTSSQSVKKSARTEPPISPPVGTTQAEAIRTTALGCTKLGIDVPVLEVEAHEKQRGSSGIDEELNVQCSNKLNSDLLENGSEEFQVMNDVMNRVLNCSDNYFDVDYLVNDWGVNDFVEEGNVAIDLGSLASLLDYGDWPRDSNHLFI